MANKGAFQIIYLWHTTTVALSAASSSQSNALKYKNKTVDQ